MTILERILNAKRAEVAAARAKTPVETVMRAAAKAPAPRDFGAAVLKADQREIRLIAEMKKSSPSAGPIVRDYRPAKIAETYQRHGAAALSVLTDNRYFGGDLRHLAEVRTRTSLPILRKDFIFDPYQLFESRAAGADAVLLIAEAIGAGLAGDLVPIARDLDLAVIVEVHSEANLLAILKSLGPPSPDQYLLGINNRDLTIQKTDLTTMARLARLLPTGAEFIAESGIQSRRDVVEACRAGACAVLVGEAILAAPDMGAKIDELLDRRSA